MVSPGTAGAADWPERGRDERRAYLADRSQQVAVGLGRRVRTIRLAQDRTQEEVAERTLIARNSLQVVERGVGSNPRLSTLVALAETLGVSLAQLVSDSPEDGAGREER